MAETERRKGRERGQKGTKRESGTKEKIIDVKRVAEKWEICNEEEEAARSEVEAKKIVPEKFHRWIKVFSKKQSEKMPTRKVWDHAIDVKEEFVPRKRKVYPLSREERGDVRVH